MWRSSRIQQLWTNVNPGDQRSSIRVGHRRASPSHFPPQLINAVRSVVRIIAGHCMFQAPRGFTVLGRRSMTGESVTCVDRSSESKGASPRYMGYKVRTFSFFFICACASKYLYCCCLFNAFPSPSRDYHKLSFEQHVYYWLPFTSHFFSSLECASDLNFVVAYSLSL